MAASSTNHNEKSKGSNISKESKQTKQPTGPKNSKQTKSAGNTLATKSSKKTNKTTRTTSSNSAAKQKDRAAWEILSSDKRDFGRPIVISVAIQKGGVGKTSTVLNLGGALREMGYKVLLVDCDPQCNTTSMFFDDLAGVSTLYDLLDQGETEVNDIREIIYHFEDDSIPGDNKGIDLIPCDQVLQQPDQVLPDLTKTWDYYNILKDGINQVKGDYDFVLIDTPPGQNFFMLAPLMSSDGLLIPIIAEKFSYEGMDYMLDTYRQVVERGLNEDLKVYGILINNYKKAQSGHRNAYTMLTGAKGLFSYPVFDSTIRASATISAAQDDKLSLYSSRYRSSIATADYIAVARELLDHIATAEGLNNSTEAQ